MSKKLNINTVPFIVFIPESTIGLTIIAKILNDDNTEQLAETKLNFSEVREGLLKGDEWGDSNIKYCLTEKGLKELENIN